MRYTEIGRDTRPQRSPSGLSVELDGERVVLDTASGGLHRLDRMASLIWTMLDGSASVAELVDDLADVFQAPPEVVEPDVLRMLRECGRVGLLAGVEPDPAYQPARGGAVTDAAGVEGRPASEVAAPPMT